MFFFIVVVVFDSLPYLKHNESKGNITKIVITIKLMRKQW